MASSSSPCHRSRRSERYFAHSDSSAGRLFAHVREPAGGQAGQGKKLDRTYAKEGAAWEEWVLSAFFGGRETMISSRLTEVHLGAAFE